VAKHNQAKFRALANMGDILIKMNNLEEAVKVIYLDEDIELDVEVVVEIDVEVVVEIDVEVDIGSELRSTPNVDVSVECLVEIDRKIGPDVGLHEIKDVGVEVEVDAKA
jgi:hypothetical protein